MADEEPQEPQEETKKKKKKKPIIPLVAGLLLGALGAGAALHFGGFFHQLAPPEQEALQAAVQTAVEEAIQESGLTMGGQEGSLEVTQVLELDPFIITLEQSAEAKYVRVGLGLAFNSEDAETPVVDPAIMLPRVKDYLLLYLSRLTIPDMLGVENKARIKSEILEAVAKMIPAERGKLVDVYITEFLIQ